MKVWSSFRKICKEFLDCEQYAILCSAFVNKLIHPFLPGLMKCTYEYLVLSAHHPLVDLKANLSRRTNLLPLGLPRVMANGLKSLVHMSQKKSSLERMTDSIARLVRQLGRELSKK